eukprot:scaffold7625_cov249-Chaetoceros_neogracile.AAC.4
MRGLMIRIQSISLAFASLQLVAIELAIAVMNELKRLAEVWRRNDWEWRSRELRVINKNMKENDRQEATNSSQQERVGGRTRSVEEERERKKTTVEGRTNGK